MLYSKFFPAVFLVVVAGLSAQTLGSLQGKWSGKTESQVGGELAVELVIAESKGTWRFIPRGTQRNNPCLGKDFPVSVISQSSTELSIEITGSSVMQGCSDFSATLKSAMESHLKANFPAGGTLALLVSLPNADRGEPGSTAA